MRYAVLIEKVNECYSAYVPDLPGCVATGATPEQVNKNLRESIQLHLKGLKQDGMIIPQPQCICEYIEAS